MKILFNGAECVNCGREIAVGTEAEVHPTKRGPRGGKKLVHAQCAGGSRSRRNGRRSYAGDRVIAASRAAGMEKLGKEEMTITFYDGSDGEGVYLSIPSQDTITIFIRTRVSWGNNTKGSEAKWASNGPLVKSLYKFLNVDKFLDDYPGEVERWTTEQSHYGTTTTTEVGAFAVLHSFGDKEFNDYIPAGADDFGNTIYTAVRTTINEAFGLGSKARRNPTKAASRRLKKRRGKEKFVVLEVSRPEWSKDRDDYWSTFPLSMSQGSVRSMVVDAPSIGDARKAAEKEGYTVHYAADEGKMVRDSKRRKR